MNASPRLFRLTGLTVLAAVAASVTAAPPASSVAAESLPSGIRVNGVPLYVTRLTGEGLAGYLAQLADSWRQPGSGTPAWVDVGVWRVLSHRAGRWSEVIQVRRDAHPVEALLSRIDLQSPPGRVPVLSLALPMHCQAVSTVELGDARDRAFQVSARCASGATQLARELRQRAEAADWKEAHEYGASLIQLSRGSVHITVVVGAGGGQAGGEGTWVMALEHASPGANL